MKKKNDSIVGSNAITIIRKKVEQLQNIKDTLELDCGNETYPKILIKIEEANLLGNKSYFCKKLFPATITITSRFTGLISLAGELCVKINN